MAALPELKLLCGLRFFDIFQTKPPLGLESYVREFLPILAGSAAKSNPEEFLPEEAELLASMVKLLKDSKLEAVRSEELNAFASLLDQIKAEPIGFSRIEAIPGDRTCVSCLFVEYYPDLDLPPRGRLLSLSVSADSISSKAERDDVNVRNPVEEPDDRFLEQARSSVKVARDYLNAKYALSLKKRYRFDFALDSTGARFTGDSLGVAFYNE